MHLTAAQARHSGTLARLTPNLSPHCLSMLSVHTHTACLGRRFTMTQTRRPSAPPCFQHHDLIFSLLKVVIREIYSAV